MKALYPVAKACFASPDTISGGCGSGAGDAAAARGFVSAGIGSEVTGCDRAVAVAHPAIAIAKRMVSAIVGLRCSSTGSWLAYPSTRFNWGSLPVSRRERGGLQVPGIIAAAFEQHLYFKFVRATDPRSLARPISVWQHSTQPSRSCRANSFSHLDRRVGGNCSARQA